MCLKRLTSVHFAVHLLFTASLFAWFYRISYDITYRCLFNSFVFPSAKSFAASVICKVAVLCSGFPKTETSLMTSTFYVYRVIKMCLKVFEFLCFCNFSVNHRFDWSSPKFLTSVPLLWRFAQIWVFFLQPLLILLHVWRYVCFLTNLYNEILDFEFLEIP